MATLTPYIGKSNDRLTAMINKDRLRSQSLVTKQHIGRTEVLPLFSLDSMNLFYKEVL